MELRSGYKLTEVGIVPEEWEVSSLAELGSFKNGINKSAEDFGHGSPFINLMDVFGVAKVVGSGAVFGLVRSTEAEQRTYELLSGDVLFVRSSVKPEGVGLTALVPIRLPATVFSGFLIRFRSSGRLTLEYKEYCFYLDSFRRRLIAQSTVSANTNINQNALKRIKIAFPPIEIEQRAIATALSDVDSLLDGMTRLIAKKRDLKQAAMQQLLSASTRLPGFYGEWKVKRLGDHVRFLKHGAYARADLRSRGQIKYLHYGDIHVSSDLRLNASAKSMPYLPEDRARNLDRLIEGDLVLVDASEDLEGVGKSVEIVGGVGVQLVAGLHTIAARFDKAVLADGFKTYLQFCSVFRDHLRRLAAGTKVYATSRAHIASVEMQLPTAEEQIAIATVLSDMDAELSALEARRDKTRALKQAMMQELLTGRTRLI